MRAFLATKQRVVVHLRADPDTVEEFYRVRFLYQFTLEGEAAERAVAHVEDLLVVPGELHRSPTTLTTRLEELTDRARTFITGLPRTVDLQGSDLEAFLARAATTSRSTVEAPMQVAWASSTAACGRSRSRLLLERLAADTEVLGGQCILRVQLHRTLQER